MCETIFNKERGFVMSNNIMNVAGKNIDWRDVDMSNVDWNEIWALVAEVEDINDCGDSCKL